MMGGKKKVKVKDNKSVTDTEAHPMLRDFGNRQSLSFGGEGTGKWRLGLVKYAIDIVLVKKTMISSAFLSLSV